MGGTRGLCGRWSPLASLAAELGRRSMDALADEARTSLCGVGRDEGVRPFRGDDERDGDGVRRSGIRPVAESENRFHRGFERETERGVRVSNLFGELWISVYST